MKELLAEKYRPKKIEDYIFPDQSVRYKVEKWLADGVIPNVLLSSGPGTGKSTLARLLVSSLNVDPSDVKRVNASIESGIGFVREELEPWLKKAPLGDFKIVVLEEVDRLSDDAQKALRAVTEDYSSRARFVATANYPGNISAALHSRFQHLEMGSMDEDGVIDLVVSVLENEGITLRTDEDDLFSHINAHSPDIRKILNSIDEFTEILPSGERVLNPYSGAIFGADTEEWVALWETGNAGDNLDRLLELSALIDKNNFEWFYSVMYKNTKCFKDRGAAVVLLSQYLARAMNQANQRLHLEAFLYSAFVLGD